MGSMSVNKNIIALSDSDGYGSGPCWIGSNTVIENKLNTDPEIKTWFRPGLEPSMKNSLQKVLPSMYCHGSNLPYICAMQSLALKGHGHEPNFPRFLHKSLWPRSLTLHFEPFRFWLRILGDIRIRKTTPRIGESGSRQDCLEYPFFFQTFK
jgi:hypothetical protein